MFDILLRYIYTQYNTKYDIRTFISIKHRKLALETDTLVLKEMLVLSFKLFQLQLSWHCPDVDLLDHASFHVARQNNIIWLVE